MVFTYRLYLLCILELVIYVGIRQCYGYIYPGNSALGIFVAIAVPLNLPHRNVFVSYNFEANYNLPGDAKTIIPGPYERFTPIEDMVFGEQVATNGEVQDEVIEEAGRKQSESINNELKSKKKTTNSKALITRQAIYQILRDNLKASGFKGEACLLKLICEVNSSLLGKNNGVFGSILHILLTPSTSSYENVPFKMYKAEDTGVKGNCSIYENKCPHDIMDLFSTPIEDFLYKKM